MSRREEGFQAEAPTCSTVSQNRKEARAARAGALRGAWLEDEVVWPDAHLVFSGLGSH